MSYTFTQLPGEPIIVFKAHANYDVQAEIQSVLHDATALLNATKEPVFQIVDFSAMPGIDMEDLMVGTSASARGEESPFHHPKVRETIFVTNNPAFTMTARGLSNEVYGNLYVPVFENYEDALAYCRTQLE
jgi:hypothetical protein